MRLSKEAKIGLFITTALIVLYSGFTFLKGGMVFKRDPTYYAVYEGDVKGLSTGGAVLLHGVQVGKVRGLEICPDYRIRVTFTLDKSKGIKLTDATVAKLVKNSLLGGSAIKLSLEEGKPLKSGSTIKGQVEQDLEELLTAYSRPILQDVQALTTLVHQLITKLVANTDQINAVCTDLAKMAQELRQAIATNQTTFNAIGKNLADASSVLGDEKNGLGALLAKLKQLAEEVEDMKLKDMAVKLASILNKLDDGPLHKNLNQILLDLDQLLVDIRTNPSRYIKLSFFGNNAGSKESRDKTDK